MRYPGGIPRRRLDVERLENRWLMSVDVAVHLYSEQISVRPGDVLSYHVTVKNEGTDNASQVELSQRTIGSLQNMAWRPASNQFAETRYNPGPLAIVLDLAPAEAIEFVVTGVAQEDPSGAILTSLTATFPGGQVDADESNNQFELSISVLSSLDGDLDHDGVVALSDFLILASNFSRDDEAVHRSDGDVDGDGLVGFNDFLILAGNYGAIRSDFTITQQSANSGGTWGPMDGASMIFLGDDLFLMGGWGGINWNADWDSAGITNLIYKSTDFGQTWSKIRDHDTQFPADHFDLKHTFNSFTMTVDGIEYIYVIGGDVFRSGTDVRRSSDGITWEEVAPIGSMPFEGRVLTFAGVLDDKIYVMGGIDNGLYAEFADNRNEVFVSTDFGATFTSLGNAPWGPRASIDRLVNFNGKLWVIGGALYHHTSVNREYYNDVWSFDGATWTEELADGHDQFQGSGWPSTFAYQGFLYYMRGERKGLNQSGIWRSQDGKTWLPVEHSLPPSHADSVAVHSSGVYVAAGHWTFGPDPPPTNTQSPTVRLN